MQHRRKKCSNHHMEELLKELFQTHFGEAVEKAAPLKGGGSDRKLVRLINTNRSVIGVTNPDRQENAAFLEFSKHFRRTGLPAPLIYVEDLDQGIYLEEDLGDTTLFQLLSEVRSRKAFRRVSSIFTRRWCESCRSFKSVPARRWITSFAIRAAASTGNP
jgi:aminoglycoside/choline kinase family phosphotransferase